MIADAACTGGKSVVETVSIWNKVEHFIHKCWLDEPCHIEGSFSILALYDLKFLAQDPPLSVKSVFRSTVDECLYKSSWP